MVNRVSDNPESGKKVCELVFGGISIPHKNLISLAVGGLGGAVVVVVGGVLPTFYVLIKDICSLIQ